MSKITKKQKLGLFGMTETKTIDILDCIAFTKVLKGRISDRLILYFGDKMKTDMPHKDRTSHCIKFYCRVMGSFTDHMGDHDFAGYKIDDYHGHMQGDEFLAKERNRLLVDIEKTDNIVLFLIDIFNLQ